MLEHFQSTNQSGRGGRTISLSPEWYVEVSPELAAGRSLNEGDWVRLSSRRGTLDVPIVVTDRVQGNVLFISIHQGKPGINQLTGEHHDPAVNTPAYKEIAVQLQPLQRPAHPGPLPAHNFRHGKRTPINKVPVEEKWRRDDYDEPPAHEPHPERF